MRKLGLAVYGRWSEAWREVAAGTLAAVLAWVIAQKVFGHPNPMFAAVIAVVCLAPGIPSYRKQAWGLVLGVATGIAVSEVALLLPHPVLRMVFGLFVSMMAVLVRAGPGCADPGGRFRSACAHPWAGSRRLHPDDRRTASGGFRPRPAGHALLHRRSA